MRSALGVDPDRPLVLVTLGGVPGSWTFFDRLRQAEGVRFLFPGGAESPGKEGNLTLLPPHSGFYHPDLVRAADAVVGKAGYSTLAEVHEAGPPFGYILPGSFRESAVLAGFVRDRMPGMPIPEPRFLDGSWVDDLPALLSLARSPRRSTGGAEAAARLLLEVAGSGGGGALPSENALTSETRWGTVRRSCPTPCAVSRVDFSQGLLTLCRWRDICRQKEDTLEWNSSLWGWGSCSP